MYLLDTNHCSSLFKDQNPNIIDRINLVNDDKLAICVVIEAELLFMVKNSARAEENLNGLDIFIRHWRNYNIDSKVADIYSKVKAGLIKKFGPEEKAKRRKFHIKQLGISDNDLWIASVALSHNLIVLSQDKDFKRISEVCDLKVESWL